MKPAVEMQLKTQIPTPLVGEYTVRIKAIDRHMAYAVIEHGYTVRKTILPAVVSADWLKYMQNKYAVVQFRTAKCQTEVIIQDRVAYVDNKRVYINSKMNTMPKVSVDY
jgi:hypothetical protein